MKGVAAKSFKAANGGAEYFITVAAQADLPAAAQIALLEDRYGAILAQLGLSPDSAIFRRVFVSDAINQSALVQQSALVAETPDNPVAVSVIQQPPVDGTKISLLAYHVDGPALTVKRRLSARHLLVERQGARHLWSTRICAHARQADAPADQQTDQAFADLTGALKSQGATLLDHCVRTWLYVKDVDIFYHALVRSRNDLFEREGLTAQTHYISSTGIEGACDHQFDVIAMDAYSILDLQARQMSFLNDFSKMCPTRDYNVAFERGTRIGYADRAHYFISGTASIDAAGQALHRGDVIAQLARALENIDAILRSGQAGLADMMYFIVYLRDLADHGRVRAYLDARFPGLPMILVLGAVCRPEWLIELEGVAVGANADADLPPF